MLAGSSASASSPGAAVSLTSLNYQAFREAYDSAKKAVAENKFKRAETLFLRTFDYIPAFITEVDLDKTNTVVEFWQAYNQYHQKYSGAQKPAHFINPLTCNIILKFIRENKDIEAHIKVGLIHKIASLYNEAGNTLQTVVCVEQLIDMVDKNEVPGEDFVSEYCESLNYLAHWLLSFNEIDKQSEAVGTFQKIIAHPKLMPSDKIKYIGAWANGIKNRLQAEAIYAPETINASIKSVLEAMSVSDTDMPVPLIYNLFFEVLLKLNKNNSELSQLYDYAAQCVSSPVSAEGMFLAFDQLDFIKRLCKLIDGAGASLQKELVWILKIIFKTMQKNPQAVPKEFVASWVQKVLQSLGRQDVSDIDKTDAFRRALTKIENQVLEARLNSAQNYLQAASFQISTLTSRLSNTKHELAKVKIKYSDALETIAYKNQQLVNMFTYYSGLEAQLKKLQDSSNSSGAAAPTASEASGEGVGAKRSHAQAFTEESEASAGAGAKGAFALNRSGGSASSAGQATQGASSAPRL